MRRTTILPLFCAFPIILAACGDTPAGIEARGAKLDNGGSYGSGGRAADAGAPAGSDSTATAGDATVVACNGGSYGSGGRSEECPE